MFARFLHVQSSSWLRFMVGCVIVSCWGPAATKHPRSSHLRWFELWNLLECCVQLMLNIISVLVSRYFSFPLIGIMNIIPEVLDFVYVLSNCLISFDPITSLAPTSTVRNSPNWMFENKNGNSSMSSDMIHLCVILAFLSEKNREGALIYASL